MASRPPNTHPKSAARNGIQANKAICFKSICRTLLKYKGNQKLSVPHVGSARKRGRAIPQKLRCARIFTRDGREPSPCRCFSWPDEINTFSCSERAECRSG